METWRKALGKMVIEGDSIFFENFAADVFITVNGLEKVTEEEVLRSLLSFLNRRLSREGRNLK